MMAVLVLLALLSAVVLPNFERWFNNTEERAKAAELATILQKIMVQLLSLQVLQVLILLVLIILMLINYLMKV